MNRPFLTRDQAIDLANEIFALTVDSAVTKSAKELDSYDDRNFYLRGVKEGKEGEFLLKVYSPSGFSKEFANAIHKVMFCLKDGGIVCPVPQKTVTDDFVEMRKLPATLPNHEVKKRKIDEQDALIPCGVCLFTFVPGKTMKDFIQLGRTFDDDFFYQLGNAVAIVSDALKDLKCPILEKREFQWDLYYFNVMGCPKSITGKQKELVKVVENSFQKCVKPRLGVLPKQCIHGDMNDGNLVISQDAAGAYSFGLIDFGDVNYSCRVFEIAIAAAYMTTCTALDNAVTAAAITVAGFHDKCPLKQDESDVIMYCIQARLCQSVCIGVQSSEVYPENAEYLLYTVKKAWKILETLGDISKDDFDKKWRSLCKN